MKLKKNLFRFTIVVYLFSCNMIIAQAQVDTVENTPPPSFLIIKNDKTQYIGNVLYQDAREVLIKTEKLGEIIIPKHEIKEIRELISEDFKDGIFVGEELFATRYFLTTNGLPVKKGESYIQWNLFGPDFQFGIADNIGLGVMTSWFAIPIVGTAKYSKSLGERTHMAVGALLGTGSWAQPDFGLILPFTAITSGNRSHNINFSFGYGLVAYKETNYNPNTGFEEVIKNREGRFLLSFAGMTKFNDKISFVFDSFIMPQGKEKEYTYWDGYWNETTQTYVNIQRREYRRPSGILVLVPGIRWQTQPNQAFQFGFTGVRYEKEFIPMPIPMVQWYRKM